MKIRKIEIIWENGLQTIYGTTGESYDEKTIKSVFGTILENMKRGWLDVKDGKTIFPTHFPLALYQHCLHKTWEEVYAYKIDQYMNVSLQCTQCEANIILPFRKGLIQECPVCDRAYAITFKIESNSDLPVFDKILVKRD